MNAGVLACAVSAAGVLCLGGFARGGGVGVFENTVESFGVVKRGNYVQVDAVTVGTQSYDFYAGFTEQSPADHLVQVADFKYENMDMIPDSVGILEVSPGVWAWDDPAMYGNEAAMDFFYPPANDYIFRLMVDGMGAFEEAIDGPSNLYPDAVPRVNNYAALQGVDVTSDVSVQFDGFGSVGAQNVVGIRVEPQGSNAVAWSGQGLNSDSMLTIPGGALSGLQTYDLFLIYETLQSYDDRTTVFPDATAEYAFRYETRVTFSTVPGAGVASVFGLMGVAAARRRRG